MPACLPQKASIVFTKESLLAFLKTHNIDVGPNYAEISKVPRWVEGSLQGRREMMTVCEAGRCVERMFGCLLPMASLERER